MYIDQTWKNMIEILWTLDFYVLLWMFDYKHGLNIDTSIRIYNQMT